MIIYTVGITLQIYKILSVQQGIAGYRPSHLLIDTFTQQEFFSYSGKVNEFAQSNVRTSIYQKQPAVLSSKRMSESIAIRCACTWKLFASDVNHVLVLSGNMNFCGNEKIRV